MYIELFRVQADAIDMLEDVITKLKIAHLVTEEMVLSAKGENITERERE
jgi:hypothetical protein